MIFNVRHAVNNEKSYSYNESISTLYCILFTDIQSYVSPDISIAGWCLCICKELFNGRLDRFSTQLAQNHVAVKSIRKFYCFKCN